MTAEAEQLLAEAERVEAAAELEIGLPESGARLAGALAEVLGEANLASVSPRAMWRLLWLAADLTTQVDVYRATALLEAVERLFARHFQLALTGPGELAETAEMAFDLFFNRPDQPLVSYRFDPVLGTLGRVLELDNRHCRRAALHGLGHVRQQARSDAQRTRIDALFDAFLLRNEDAGLAVYAARSRAGELA